MACYAHVCYFGLEFNDNLFQQVLSFLLMWICALCSFFSNRKRHLFWPTNSWCWKRKKTLSSSLTTKKGPLVKTHIHVRANWYILGGVRFQRGHKTATGRWYYSVGEGVKKGASFFQTRTKVYIQYSYSMFVLKVVKEQCCFTLGCLSVESPWAIIRHQKAFKGI